MEPCYKLTMKQPKPQPVKRISRILHRVLLALLVLAAIFVYFAWPYSDLIWFRYGVKGIDVSHHQGKIDWQALANSDIAFAYMKATEGGTFVDDQFAANWKAAKDAGLAVGAYHFFTQCKTGEEQAKSFLAQLPKDKDQLLPVLDAEKMEACSDGTTTIDVPKEVLSFLDAVERDAGCRPIIYTDANFDDVYLAGKFKTEKYWARSLFWPPDYREKNWVYWQYTELGQRRGVNTPLDLDIYRGRPADFAAFRKAAGCFAKSS